MGKTIGAWLWVCVDKFDCVLCLLRNFGPGIEYIPPAPGEIVCLGYAPNYMDQTVAAVYDADNDSIRPLSVLSKIGYPEEFSSVIYKSELQVYTCLCQSEKIEILRYSRCVFSGNNWMSRIYLSHLLEQSYCRWDLYVWWEKRVWGIYLKRPCLQRGHRGGADLYLNVSSACPFRCCGHWWNVVGGSPNCSLRRTKYYLSYPSLPALSSKGRQVPCLFGHYNGNSQWTRSGDVACLHHLILKSKSKFSFTFRQFMHSWHLM